MTTLSQALVRGVAALRAAGIADAATDARALLAHACGIDPARLTLHLPEPADPSHLAVFDALIARRADRAPVSHLIGHRLFWGRRFAVTPDVLDPRPETEILVAEALSKPFVKLLDLGTGSGCILLSCLADRPMAAGVGVDISAAALAVAARNADDLGLGARARLLHSDWFSDVQGRFDLIVSNPPYIAAEEMAGLSPEVLQEPHLALSPGGDGLEPYRIIARAAPAHLMPGGRLIVEIGPSQGAAVSRLFREQGLQQVAVLPDFDGRDRIVVAQKPADGETCGEA